MGGQGVFKFEIYGSRVEDEEKEVAMAKGEVAAREEGLGYAIKG